MADLVAAQATYLFAKIPHDDGQTILREALLVADHNAYHLGAPGGDWSAADKSALASLRGRG